MMTAEKLEQKVECIKSRIAKLEKNREHEMELLRETVESDYVDMDFVIAHANRIKELDASIDCWTDKLYMVEDIIEAE